MAALAHYGSPSSRQRAIGTYATSPAPTAQRSQLPCWSCSMRALRNAIPNTTSREAATSR
jgi:hypothetical protein